MQKISNIIIVDILFGKQINIWTNILKMLKLVALNGIKTYYEII